jgi:hypothetical protein
MKRIILVGRNDQLPPFLPPRAPLQTRGNLARSVSYLPERAPLFDATADRWIAPPSGVKPDAGAAAELRHTQAAQTRPAGPLAPLNRRAGRPLLEVLEFFVCVIGIGASAMLAVLLWAVLS